ncbi:MAG: amidohydrolase family protein [Gemmatimonadales bacterium]
MSRGARWVGAALAGALNLPAIAAGQPADRWSVTDPRGATRTIDFETSEGTWMSVDIAPDGSWVVFDLLGHVYRVSSSGGPARALTQESGIAVNFQPRIAPDGRTIAFISDRDGRNNLWLMDADGGNPRRVSPADVPVTHPAWSPDGEYVLVERDPGIWMYHRGGGQGIELVGREPAGAGWPSMSRDGRSVYFGTRPRVDGLGGVLAGSAQLARLDLETGKIHALTYGVTGETVRFSSGGGAAPEVSPDGRWLAFARPIPDGTLTYRGHTIGPRWALWLRDLVTGAERLLLDPIEFAASENRKVHQLLPGYSWSADARSIVVAQGGGLRRVDVASGRVDTIRFTARVHRVVSEQAYAPGRIRDDSLEVRFMRWPTASPDGRALAVQALGRIWIRRGPGADLERLTPAEFAPFEYAPTWSPDGRWIAFTTWDDSSGGQVWRAPVGGGPPVRLSRESGEYVHPVWRADGAELLVARGSGATARGQGMMFNAWYDVVRLDVATGDQVTVATVDLVGEGIGSAFNNVRTQAVRASYGPAGRIWFPELRPSTEGGGMALVSVMPRGGDRRIHAVLPLADEVVPSPDGRSVAFQQGDNVYVSPLPPSRPGGEPPRIERRRAAVPVTRLTQSGGLFPRWRDASTVELGSGTSYYAHHTTTGRTDTVALPLTVPKRIARGTIALRGARIVTLGPAGVIERGDVVVRDGRLACVGSCPTPAADSVIDASGTTIIPGLIDTHSHNFRDHRGVIPRRNPEMAVFLANGVTTTMDPSLWSQNVFPAAELVEAGLIVGARAFSTGDPLFAGDNLRSNAIESYADAEQEIAKLQSWGAISLKQYWQPRREQRQWITDVARRRGLMVTAENRDLDYVLSLVFDGHTGFEHQLPQVPLYGDVSQLLGRAGITYAMTHVVDGPGPWNEGYFLARSDVWLDPIQRRFVPWRELVSDTRQRVLRPATDYSYPLLAQGLADIIAAGGFGSFGGHGQQNGVGTHWEIWMAASALGPLGALEVASRHAARFLGRDRDLGSLEPGKIADLVVLDANPLDDIRNTRTLRYVMKGGILHEAATLDEIWPERRPYGRRFWDDPDVLQRNDRVIRR